MLWMAPKWPWSQVPYLRVTCDTISQSLLHVQISLYNQTFSNYRPICDKCAPTNSKIALNTTRSTNLRYPYICVTSGTVSHISIRFALQLAVLEIQSTTSAPNDPQIVLNGTSSMVLKNMFCSYLRLPDFSPLCSTADRFGATDCF